jgi:hypothetical protein
MPIINKAIALVGGVLLSSAAFCSLAGDEVVYFDLSNPSRQFVVGERGASLGKMLFPVDVCPPSSEYICFNGAGVYFSVPRKARQLDKWQHADVDYVIVARQRMFFLGEVVDAIFIEGKGKNRADFRYTYSYDRGLMSVDISAPGENGRSFLLEGRCGFGASMKCSSAKK